MALSDKQIKKRLRVVKDFILRHPVLSVLSAVVLFIFIRIVLRKKSVDSGLNTIDWLKNPYVACDVSFIGYGQAFAVLRYAHIDLKTRTFSIPCVGYKPYYRFTEGPKANVLNTWMKNMTLYEYSYSEPVTSTTIAIFRTEAHNLFRSMCDWYNLFLVCTLLNLDPKQVTILFMDDRPPSLLEDLWYILFGKITRYHFIPMENSYKTLVWNIFGYESLINTQNLPHLPYLTEFQDFILHSFNIHPSSSFDCKRLNITIIYRRNFMSHPEREDALVYRKFYNDTELTAVVSGAFPGHNVRGLFLEYFSVKEQLKVMAGTDILVGMHGAGMTHILFLPSHAGCFEIFPKYTDFHDKYKALAKWKGLHYIRWKNADPKNEFPGFKTKVPTGVLIEHLNILYRKLCGTQQQRADNPAY
jgi:glycoprotein 2-beta-D-xylosyltransferase